ncbi:MAG TPA: UDP-N-acetylmuramate dehydrogenase [Firmicutes bacterium]|nr:UDP-N-acetylmuramate dehydrogenase [Bacillota bacterium]
MFLKDYPLANVTSLGVGGPADFFIRPGSTLEIIAAQRFALEKGYPLTVIGYGTNLLIRDGGIRGIVIQIAEPFAKARVKDNVLTATTGCLFSSLSKLALHHSLQGLEFAVGIPGGLGGAVFMNAGAYQGEIGPLIRKVEFVQDGTAGFWGKDEFSFSYRSSRLQKEQKKTIVTAVTLELERGEHPKILEQMLRLQQQRRSKQPLDYPSAGSTFKRPPGYYVGPLLEEAGLKGLRVGGAEVSRKHAGFLIKVGEAKARDFLDLIAEIQSIILAKHGVHLEPEVRVLGED